MTPESLAKKLSNFLNADHQEILEGINLILNKDPKGVAVMRQYGIVFYNEDLEEFDRDTLFSMIKEQGKNACT